MEEKGYATIEAVEWSPLRQAWFLLPERVSHTPYKSCFHPNKGSNQLLKCSANFDKCEAIEILQMEFGTQRGFKYMQFVPGTQDSVIAGIRVLDDKQIDDDGAAFLSLFTTEGEVLRHEVHIPTGKKRVLGLTFIL